MPLYDYTCERKHTTEERQGLEVTSIPCPRCGRKASRAGVYRGQYIQAETGPVGGKKNAPDPVDEDWRQPFREFKEASEQVKDSIERQEKRTGVKVANKDLFGEALANAHRKDQRIKAGSGEEGIGRKKKAPPPV